MKLRFFFRPIFFERYSDIKFRQNPSSGSRVVPCGGTDGRTDVTKVRRTRPKVWLESNLVCLCEMTAPSPRKRKIYGRICLRISGGVKISRNCSEEVVRWSLTPRGLYRGGKDICCLCCSRMLLVESSCNVMAHGTHGRGVKGKLANGVGSQYPSHYLVTRCIQHYYRWCAHFGCQ